MNTPPSPPGAERTGESAVQIGVLVPLTRPGWVEAGRHLFAGLKLAVREVNDASGVVGRPLELVVRDTADEFSIFARPPHQGAARTRLVPPPHAAHARPNVSICIAIQMRFMRQIRSL